MNAEIPPLRCRTLDPNESRNSPARSSLLSRHTVRPPQWRYCHAASACHASIWSYTSDVNVKIQIRSFTQQFERRFLRFHPHEHFHLRTLKSWAVFTVCFGKFRKPPPSFKLAKFDMPAVNSYILWLKPATPHVIVYQALETSQTALKRRFYECWIAVNVKKS